MYVDGFLKWQPAVFLLTCPSIYRNNPRLEFICTKNLQTFPLNMILLYSKSTKLIKLHHLYTFISQCFIFQSLFLLKIIVKYGAKISAKLTCASQELSGAYLATHESRNFGGETPKKGTTQQQKLTDIVKQIVYIGVIEPCWVQIWP